MTGINRTRNALWRNPITAKDANMADAARYLSVERWKALTAAHSEGAPAVECADQPTTDGEDGHRYFTVAEPVESGGFIFLRGKYRAG